VLETVQESTIQSAGLFPSEIFAIHSLSTLPTVRVTKLHSRFEPGPVLGV